MSEEQNQNIQNEEPKAEKIDSGGNIKDGSSQVLPPEEELIEVVENPDRPTISNKQEILKLFANMNQNKQVEPLNQPIISKKKSSFKKKQHTKQKIQQQDKSGHEEKKDKILKAIEPEVRKYKALNSPNFHDSEVNKMKYEGKEKLFKFILYNVHELREIHEKNLSEEQKKVIKMTTEEAYNFAKSFANEVSGYFISNLNQNNRNTLLKKYKSQWKSIILNIQDQSNVEFRTKISTGQWTPQKLAQADQLQFYPQAKRQMIMQRNQRLLNQLNIEENLNEGKQAEEAQFQKQGQQEVPKKPIEIAKQEEIHGFVEESTIGMLKEFLSDGQVDKMKKMILSEVQGDIQHKIHDSLCNVFRV